MLVPESTAKATPKELPLKPNASARSATSTVYAPACRPLAQKTNSTEAKCVRSPGEASRDELLRAAPGILLPVLGSCPFAR